jgi:class 3 adenylate cyclase
MNSQIDVRHVLPTIAVPTLVLHRTGDRDSNVEEGRYLASRILGARFVELEGDDHVPWSDPDQIIDEIEGFLTGVRRGPDPDRVLATILFTDLVRSTERAVELGDRRWAGLIEAHHATVRRELGRFRGRELDVAGDGFFAAFDGPARAVRCATAVREALRRIGLGVRAGVHTGECEQVEEKLAGLAVVVGARISAKAEEGEVLVSGTVRDLVAGSGLEFEDRGEHELKGVPGTWRLYAVP